MPSPIRVVLFFDSGLAGRPLPLASTGDPKIARAVLRSAIATARRHKQRGAVNHLERLADILQIPKSPGDAGTHAQVQP